MDKPQSLRRLIANRANARLSTGPRTPAGKARARLNARRHGLAGDLTGDPDFEQLIGILGRDVADPEQRALVREIAESQCALNRAQTARRHALQAELDRVIEGGAPDTATLELVADDQIGRAVLGASHNLVAIDRYERRAFSRRRKTIRELTRLIAMERNSIKSGPQEDKLSLAVAWQNEPKPSRSLDNDQDHQHSADSQHRSDGGSSAKPATTPTILITDHEESPYGQTNPQTRN